MDIRVGDCLWGMYPFYFSTGFRVRMWAQVELNMLAKGNAF